MKKKIITICLVIALAATAIVGASLAYFTDTKTAENTFTLGNVKIELDETNIDDPNGDRVDGNEYNVYPGQTVTKDPVVHNVGKNAAYIRAKINVCNWMNECATYFPDAPTYGEADYKNTLLLIIDALGEGWSIEEVTTGDHFTIGDFDAKFILKYEGTLAAETDTSAMFTKVTVPAAIQNDQPFSEMTIVAEAMQADGFDSWEDAFAAFDGK